MIVIFGPERTGTSSVTRLFSGHDRVQAHFVRDKYNRTVTSGFFSKDNRPHSLPKGASSQLVVLMARDPIARVVSECFHKVNEDELEPCPDDMEPAIWVMAVGDHDAAVDHLVYEIPAMGLDILSVPFRPPVMVYATKPLILACRLKDVDALPKTLGENGFPMFGRKITRLNACSYPELKFPKCYVDRMMDNVYTMYFYTDEEIDEMRNKWTIDG